MLSDEAKDTLREAGFTKMEVGMIDSAQAKDGSPQDTDISVGVWQSVIESRKDYIGRLGDEGWEDGEIQDAIDSYYEGDEANPWDFLKIEYRPPKKLTDFQYAAAQNAKRRINSHFGSRYSKRQREA